MAQLVHQFDSKSIIAMKKYYDAFQRQAPPGAVFQAKTENAVITAYQSGKVLFQGKHPEKEFHKWNAQWNTGETKNHKQKSKSSSPYTPNPSLFNRSIIGSDEAGTGDYFGPITVAAAYVEAQQIQQLSSIGVQDSKNLSDEKIVSIAKELIRMQVPYSLLILHNDKYNTLQENGWSQGKMKAMLHHHAIQKTKKKIGDARLDGIIIDQFCEPTIYKRHLASERETLPNDTYFMTKAESHSIAVAAASILARASFVKEMERLSTFVGIPLRKGASRFVDENIAEVMKKKGEPILRQIAKLHFANTMKAKKYL
ncbi:ribonuclease HIII [Ornithinibacillus gellani]|uniref:ribonuclease HIII n=1 Tax=Ornithinibacillus gellani TaxID=2293253 RepID=UPI000F4752F3|nr:ribonuclease HIII [Ornithinibacillus gellani]TQS76152.1 ribonuclease HIII [Ornithinibacillus gellani]